MSTWRGRALEVFPELRQQVEHAESIGMLWIELHMRFCEAYRKPETQESLEFVRRICLYAIWCSRSESQKVREPAFIEFYEQVPAYALSTEPPVRERILRDLLANLGMAEIQKMGINLTESERKKFFDYVAKLQKERELRTRKRSL